jgi:hypothetical protein
MLRRMEIEFGEWIRINAYDTGIYWCYLEDNCDYTTIELFEIFKKEKSLGRAL